jgi:ribosomal protein L18
MDLSIPDNLKPIKPPFNHLDAAKRAVALVAEVAAADAKGLLSHGRVASALSALNSDLYIVAQELNVVANNPRLFVLRENRRGQQVVGRGGDLKTLAAWSSLQRSYTTLLEAMTEIEILWETKRV